MSAEGGRIPPQTTEFESYLSGEDLRSKIKDEVEKEVRREVWDEIEATLSRKWQLSAERWFRFLKVIGGLVVAAIIGSLIWGLVSLFSSASEANVAQDKWDVQCQKDGGIIFVSDKEYYKVRACAVGTEIVRYYE